MTGTSMHKTKYPGVYFRLAKRIGGPGDEKVFFISFRKEGKFVWQKAGRQLADDMTPARAAAMRGAIIENKQPTRKELKEQEEIQRQAILSRWTIERLWETYKQSKPALKGLATDQNRFALYIGPNFGAKEPSELTPFEVDGFRVKLLKKRTPGTVKNIMELLRRIVNFGTKKNHCAGPSFKVELPAVNNLRTEDLTSGQLDALLRAIEADPNAAAGNIMKMVLFTGMRRGELFRLQWDDVDFERGFIHLREPKGGSDQTIPLNDAARKLLKNLPRSASPYIFPGRHGDQRQDIIKQVNRIKERAGLPKNFRALHGLRHVYASMLASSGKVDMYTLQKLLTHKSPTMTQRYAHLRDETLLTAAQLAGDLVTTVGSPETISIHNGQAAG